MNVRLTNHYHIHTGANLSMAIINYNYLHLLIRHPQNTSIRLAESLISKITLIVLIMRDVNSINYLPREICALILDTMRKLPRDVVGIPQHLQFISQSV